MARRRRKRKSNYKKNKNFKKIERLSRDKSLSDEDVLKEFRKYIIEENVDPIDIRASFEKFSKEYNIRNNDE